MHRPTNMHLVSDRWMNHAAPSGHTKWPSDNLNNNNPICNVPGASFTDLEVRRALHATLQFRLIRGIVANLELGKCEEVFPSLPFRSFPPLSFPPLRSPPPLLFPPVLPPLPSLRVGPLNPARGSGEPCKHGRRNVSKSGTARTSAVGARIEAPWATRGVEHGEGVSSPVD